MEASDESAAQRERLVRQSLQTARVAFASAEWETEFVRSVTERSLSGESFYLPLMFFPPEQPPDLLFGCMKID